MAVSTWEEVRRLATDFQRVQQGTSAQRLSERNCIEIVTSLMKLKLLDVIYTTDGKEYITPQHLLREIRDEIYISGGRVNVVDIAQALNVDLSHIENAAKELTKSDSSLQFVLGQLISSDYIASMADQVNEKLQEKGIVNLADLTLVFDLPGDFLLRIVNENLGMRIHGQRDTSNPRILLTDWLVARHRAVLRGALNASCRPVPIQNLIKEHSLNERITAVVVEELITLGEVSGTLSGKGSKDKSIFIPHVYITAQNAWVDAFLKSNRYIPYDAVKKLDISEPKAFLKNRYSTADFLFLTTCIVPESVLDQVENGIEDVASSGTWTEVSGLLPAGVDEADVAEVVTNLISSKKLKGVRLVNDTFVLADKMLEDSAKQFESLIEKVTEEEAVKHSSILMASTSAAKKADDDTDSMVSSKKDRKGKKQPGKKETQGKSRKDSEQDEGSVQPPNFLKTAQIVLELQKIYKEAPYELLNSIAESIQSTLVAQYRHSLDTKARAIAASSVNDRKQSHKSIQDQINTTVWLMRLFSKGIEHFSSAADKKQLSKLLLRNIGSEIMNPLLLLVMDDLGMAIPEKTDFTPEARTKLILKLPEPQKSLFDKCNSASSADSIETFETSLLNLTESDALGMPIKNVDKKKEATMIEEHRKQLLEGIRSAQDVATALRLCCLALFLKKTGTPLEAPGKLVPQVMAILKPNLSVEQAGFLDTCREMVQGPGQFPRDQTQETIDKLLEMAS
ncbi:hypothetical protein RvY_07169-2 [Ramazzottius varieornatus]|uniref:E3 UFM1-protein ligase 1 homolog n=1 Tax=Ramazzottius varieornatus TaxID=947166 RepID=A0A1D1V3T2_RAMVA|nr:hypothetical protein RvY_07169-2 [Ramazzottius varieornatus]